MGERGGGGRLIGSSWGYFRVKQAVVNSLISLRLSYIEVDVLAVKVPKKSKKFKPRVTQRNDMTLDDTMPLFTAVERPFHFHFHLQNNNEDTIQLQ